MRCVLAILSAAMMFSLGCRTHEPFICGTALLENAMADHQAQASPFVFCPQQEADLILTVAVTVGNAHPQHSGQVYFRKKRPDERVTVRETITQLFPAKSTHPHTLDRAWVLIRGEELWVATEVHWGQRDPASTGSLSLGRPVSFSRDLRVEEAGGVLECSWKNARAD